MADENAAAGGAGGTTNTDAGGKTDAGNTSLIGGDKTGDNANQDKGKADDKGADPGDKGADKQTDNKDAKAPVVPDKYELKLPDGVLVDDGLMKEFTELGKTQKWDNATAQKMADMHLKAIGMFAQKQEAEHEHELLGWHKELIDDKELGGAKIDATMTQARKVIALAGTIPGVKAERLTQDLLRTGMATHPDLVRVFHYLGQALGEDNKLIKGNLGDNAPKDAATLLYGPSGVKSKT